MLCMNFSVRNNVPVALPKKPIKMQPIVKSSPVSNVSLIRRLMMEKPSKCGSCGGAR